ARCRRRRTVRPQMPSSFSPSLVRAAHSSAKIAFGQHGVVASLVSGMSSRLGRWCGFGAGRTCSGCADR
ncbi:hypothetical protein, partial [Escherichia coli]|uniref:hypothetical protein n=1 Tax=Escherichia coli TaxID=562 RepID=UPI0028E095F6